MNKLLQALTIIPLLLTTVSFGAYFDIIGANGDVIYHLNHCNSGVDAALDMSLLENATIKIQNSGFGSGGQSYLESATQIYIVQNGQTIGYSEAMGHFSQSVTPFPALRSFEPISISRTPGQFCDLSFTITNKNQAVELPCDGSLNAHKRGISSMGCPFLDVRVGDKIFFSADGAQYARTIVDANAW